MAQSGRHDVDFEGVDPQTLAFKYDNTIVYDATQEGGSAQCGLAVTLTATRTVGLVDDGQAVHGKLLKVEKDGFCTVQTEGGASLPAGNGASVTAGRKIVGALQTGNAKGYIRQVNTATAAEAFVARHTILENSDTTAVQVLLGC